MKIRFLLNILFKEDIKYHIFTHLLLKLPKCRNDYYDVAFIGLIVFFTMQKTDMTTLFASLPESEKSAVIQTLKQNGVNVSLNPSTGELVLDSIQIETKQVMKEAGIPVRL